MILLFFLLALTLACLNFGLKRRKQVNFNTAVYLGVQMVFLAYIVQHRGQTELELFTYESLSVLLYGLLSLVGIASFVHSHYYLNSESLPRYRMYQAGFIGLSAAIAGAYFANNIMVTWIFLEITTVLVAVLIYHRRTPKSLEATWKYVFVCSTGMALAYFGILFMSITMRGIPHPDMSYASLADLINSGNPTYLKLAFLFTVIGYSSKMEIFPLNTIGIDANHAAPSPASGFMSTALVNLGFLSIFRIYGTLVHSPVFAWAQGVLVIAGLISLLVATIYLQRVHNLKRLLAYSTVENMGIVALALGIGGKGYYIAVLHIVVHTLLKSAAFFQLAQVGKIYKSYNVFDTGNYFNINPGGALVLVLATIGLTATPPSGLFFTELLLFKELAFGGRYVIVAFFILMLCFVVYALYSRILYVCYNPLRSSRRVDSTAIKPLLTGIQTGLIILAFVIGFYQPAWLQQLLHDTVTIFTT